ncbi:globin-1-like isoform X2 [Stylophora pistillata]|uniref:Cytoglobin-2 n=2 Tax=Stylophora pistillata TaxID=50429 RepID=A0A2B4SPY0_STYPI|nr:globin-1-like isoform X2 [Stylophora pistillata]XP_022782488.1 globin-1-like isoform X2 [Stylophora pistillata]XP_022782489.1 globin-1-like isoform X2 [Stylophora pistillata]XP_022782490.1 globin-1-like isoform X2 [Stylophora pistillata]XP_022782491.1 globin-1-like isoform X2 [Stylophora pistillata]XP_022782492.1 globin-1-like isoform X2 [Stylophora pistillata]XP_022782493.1 globin-1-like isoform X2 [Stylophora pistillata]XP_022782495.1 globin-1-like isoform X2 [Stylophora pistillata]XP_
MGCGSSSSRLRDRFKASVFPLTTAQKYLVRETWETIEIHKNSVGKKTFIKFFEKNPEYQRLFPEFKDVPPSELEKTNALYGHAKRVMKAVENAVSALDDSESFSAYLEELGRRHKTRALKPMYLDSMQEALMFVLQDLLESSWTEETADAWNKLFRFVTEHMTYGLQS